MLTPPVFVVPRILAVVSTSEMIKFENVNNVGSKNDR